MEDRGKRRKKKPHSRSTICYNHKKHIQAVSISKTNHFLKNKQLIFLHNLFSADPTMLPKTEIILYVGVFAHAYEFIKLPDTS